MRFSLIWPCLFSLVSASPHQPIVTPPTPIQKRANPSPTKGAIVVHGVGLEDLSPWRPVISHYVDNDGKWKGSNSKNIVQTKTETEDGKPTTKTQSAPIAVVTGPEKEMGVLVTPDLFTEVTDIADVVAAACSLKKRDATDSCSRAIANAVEHAGSEHPLISELLGPAGEGLSNLMEYYAIDEVFALNLATTIGGAIVFIIVKNVVEKVKDNTDTGTSLLFNFGKPSTKSSSTGENNDSPTPDEHEACDKDVGTGLEAPFCRTCGGTSKSKTCTSGKWKNCPCIFAAVGISVQKPIGVQQPDNEEQSGGWDLSTALRNGYDLYNLFRDAVESKDQLVESQKPNVTCSNSYGDAVAMDKDYMEQLGKKFCSGGQHDAILSSMDIESDQHTAARVAFKYEPGKECQATCDQGFEALFNECEGINSHLVQAKGMAIVKECNATYGYAVTQKPVCNIDKASKIPANVFQKGPVWKDFCKQENDDFKRSMIADINGNKPTLLKRDLEARTPPANTESYSKWGFTLSWEPNHQGIRTHSCSEAFEEMSQSNCGRGGNQQNLMAKEASLFVGDGTYRYSVNRLPEEVPLEKMRKISWHADKFKDADTFAIGDAIKYGKKNGKYQDPTWKACGASSGLGDGFTLTPKDHHRTAAMGFESSRLAFYIFWKKGCRLENGPQKQSTNNPLGNGEVNCAEAYRQAAGADNADNPKDNFSLGKQTYGGSQDFGCLRYIVAPVNNGWKYLDEREDLTQD